eukprot:8519094-Pyramimonas_sp.AAC.1
MGLKASPKRVLPTLSQWRLARIRCAVGARAAGQLCYAAAAAHRDVCMAVGLGAARDKRRVQLAIYCEEQAREDWAERSRSGRLVLRGPCGLFLVLVLPRRAVPVGRALLGRAAKRLDSAILGRAEEACDADGAANEAAPSETSAEGGAKGACKGGKCAAQHWSNGTSRGGSWDESGSSKGGDSWGKGVKRSWSQRGEQREPRAPPRPVRRQP